MQLDKSSQQKTFAAQPGKQSLFLSSSSDLAIYGGSRGGGKTYALLLECLRNTKNPGFQALIFRRTYPQILQPEGLWETSKKIYPYTGATGSQGNLIWKWPNGSKITFSHMENPDDKYDWLGAGIPLICFDELNTFDSQQFFFLFGSLRSTCGVKPYIRCTTNPKANSWVASFIQWWWDPETGYPIEDRSGRIRYFIRMKDDFVWGDTKEELMKDYPDSLPMSCTFIPSKVFDNKILLESNPGYLGSLKAMGTVDRERYLYGNWKISESGGKMFKREWFKTILPERPVGLRGFVRFWDVAATEPKKGNTDPDWTCGVLMALNSGIYYVCDVQRFRGTPKVVEQRILQTAQTDPYGTKIRMEMEPGSSGVTAIDHYARYVLVGFNFIGIPSKKNKVLRAGPFSSAAESGNVTLIRGAWNNNYLDELESFRGGDEKNDQCVAQGTLISTKNGNIPVEQVRAGDMVWTRKGLKWVIWSGMTNPRAQVSELTVGEYKLTATANHPVFSPDKGFSRLDSCSGVRVLCAMDSWPSIVCLAYHATVRALLDPVCVYNLEVEDEHEYFANGVLVHNCDASSGAQLELSGRTGAWKFAEAVNIAGGYSPLVVVGGSNPGYTPIGS